MTFEEISEPNLKALTGLMLKLWPDGNFAEEYESCRNIMADNEQTCFLVKKDEQYIAFIQLALRHDYVESTETTPVGYVEGIYVKKPFRKSGLARQLIALGEKWAGEKGCAQYASDAELTNLASINFHKKVGFKEVNRLVCFVKNIKTS